MNAIDKYYNCILFYFEKIYKEEAKNIETAAAMMANEIEKDHIIHAIGPGCHSQIGVEDIFFRAGGLANINAMLDFSMIDGALKVTGMERVPAIAPALLDYYKVQKGEILILINAYGINGASVEMALECLKRGIRLICITSPANSRAIPSDHPARHYSHKNLCDIPADVMIDCKMPVGDAVVEIEGLDSKVGPMTTCAISFIVQTIIAATVEILVKRGVKPPLLTSFNAPDQGESNHVLIAKYNPYIKNL